MDDDEVKKFRNRADVKKEQLNFTEIINVGNVEIAQKNYKRVYYTNLYIKMSNISDFFNKIPLITGFDCKLVINVNQGYC